LVTSLIDRTQSANELVADGIEEISTLLELQAQVGERRIFEGFS
jgi:hypothetical protein